MKRGLTLTLIFLLIPSFYQSRQMSKAESGSSFSGKTLTCGVSLGKGLRSSLNFGLNYEVLQGFGEAYGCDIKVRALSDTLDLCDSLRSKVIDIAVLSPDDTAAIKGISKYVSPDSSFIWAMNSKDCYQDLTIDSWLAYASMEDPDLVQMRELFSAPYNPRRRAEAGIRSRSLSPYDGLIKTYARTIGWDWKMLAALIYTESKFTINNISSRGAIGLMQVMPKTGSRFGAIDLMDPEENIKAGTAYIAAIQKKYISSEVNQLEREKLVLASFNAGASRIAECRRIAEMMDMNPDRWSDVVQVIPLHDSFKGSETIRYVDYVLSIYDAFRTICPY